MEPGPPVGRVSDSRRFTDSFHKAGNQGSGVVVKGLEISKHCVKRWRDRVRPGLNTAAARRELEGVLECAGDEVVDLPPDWTRLAEPDSHTSFLVVGDDLVLVLIDRGDGFLAKTCVPRGTISPWERMRRRRRSSSRNAEGRSRGRRPEPYRRSRFRNLRTSDLLSAEYERMF